MELLTIAIALIVLTVFALLANELGVDSREESNDARRPGYPVGIA